MRERKVGAAVFLDFLRLRGITALFKHLAAEFVGILVRQRLFHDWHEFAVHTELNRHLRADVEVGGAFVNGRLQEFVDCDVHRIKKVRR